MVIHSMLARILVAAAALTLAASVFAEIYTWKDANGRVHFSDQAPPSTEARPTRPTPGPKYAPSTGVSSGTANSGKTDAPAQSAPKADSAPPTAQSSPKTWQEKELEQRQRKAAEQEADAKKKDEEARAQEKKRYCENLRNNLEMLERGGRITKTNAQGEREFLDEAQMKEQADRTRGQMTRDCK